MDILAHALRPLPAIQSFTLLDIHQSTLLSFLRSKPYSLSAHGDLTI